MRILAFLTDPPVVTAILVHLELPHEPPLISPARGPPQGDFLLDQTPAFDPTDAEPIPGPRFARCPVFDQSLPENFTDGIIYTSDQTHHSIRKAAVLAGFPEANVREIPSTENFEIRLDVLADRLAEDRAAGLTPFLIVGSAGTTNTGAVDPSMPWRISRSGRDSGSMSMGRTERSSH